VHIVERCRAEHVQADTMSQLGRAVGCHMYHMTCMLMPVVAAAVHVSKGR
jgi:hypothetical protein